MAASPSPAKAEQDLSSLRSTKPPKDTTIDALRLASDSASLIRAHSTKLSLLIINKPFTPSAISAVLRELVSGPLPGLASAVELCTAAQYTKVVSAELQWRAKKLFSELKTLIDVIPLDGDILTADQKNGTGQTVGKGSLANTGVVWEACDSVVELKKIGIAGLLIKKADGYRELLKDALEELQEWGEEVSDGEEDEEGSENDTEGGAVTSAQDALDAMFASERHIPSEDPEKIRPRLESSQKRLRLIILMYQAVVKRRLKTLPPLPHPEQTRESKGTSDGGSGIVGCLDDVLDAMKKIPDITDELASAFYELDGIEIDKRMDQCFLAGFAAVKLLVNNWEGKEDEFSTWTNPHSSQMQKFCHVEKNPSTKELSDREGTALVDNKHVQLTFADIKGVIELSNFDSSYATTNLVPCTQFTWNTIYTCTECICRYRNEQEQLREQLKEEEVEEEKGDKDKATESRAQGRSRSPDKGGGAAGYRERLPPKGNSGKEDSSSKGASHSRSCVKISMDLFDKI
ncbi:hypothetical protein G7Y89_g13708 [Cudoniella acicularis]|uniref:Cyclin-D1-binding protein 1-like N-terminal domain-containing protein n=1 Tax=Cudoniella acicularis TaxID=354080 RepID=A0A8H4VVT5_9HELO|nr:hypothetical protein G7Y89_g13708 [Cudoniella acicularis]